MLCSLPADCLNEIFENLYDDKITLHSCLLVSRLWCKISVGILWRDFWGMEYHIYDYYRAVTLFLPKFPTLRLEIRVASAILSTLISCLPNESKELLHENKIFTSTPTSKQPLFNYAAFCKALSINSICQLICKVVEKGKRCLVAKEILLKMFMNKVPPLKMLKYTCGAYTLYNIPFISFSEARDCLTDLSELQCSTDIDSEFFYGLSQICHNLRSLTIHFNFESEVSNELKELVSSQNNLRNLKLSFYDYGDENNDWVNILPALMKHTNTLTKLQLGGDGELSLSLSFAFVSSFLNLQEIEFSFEESISFENFRELQYVTFPKLQVLKDIYQIVKTEYLAKFLEINGKNLQECYLDHYASELSIDKFCPNIKKLSVVFDQNELDMMKTIFNSCQDLEGISIQHKEALEIVAKHSPKNFYVLLICGLELTDLYPEDLESFFISWGNRKSKKSLSLIIVDALKVNKENMEIIEKYKNLGVVKKFEFRLRKCQDFG